MAIKQWLKNGGIAVALTVGAIEGNDLLYETSQEKEVKFATAIMADAPERAKIQAEEIEFRKVGEEVKSKRTETGQVFKGPMVTAVDDSGREYTARQFQARVFSGQKYFYDPDGDSLMALDLTVRQVEQPNVVERMIEGVKELIGIEPQPVTHDTYVKAGPYAATWFAEKPYDYTIATMTGQERVQFTALHDTTGMSVETIPTSTGMKQTWVLRDDKAATVLQWKVDSSAPMIHDGGRVLAGKFTITEPIAWDADSTAVNVSVSVRGLLLTYTVNTSKAKYPVTVDPSVIAEEIGALSGLIFCNHVTYTSARNAISGYVNSTPIRTGQYYSGTESYIDRALYRFDTSGFSGVTIDSILIKMRVEVDDTETDFNMRLCETTDSLATGYINAAMYNEFKGWAESGAYSPTYSSDTSINTSGISAGDTLTFKLNAAGLSDINISGTSQYWVLSSRDIAGNSPSGREYVEFTTNSAYVAAWYSITPLAPTNFTLSNPTTTSLYAAWTNNHSANVDSLKIYTGAGAWVKALTKTATNTTMSGLSVNTQYIYKARVDSGGVFIYSNADTAYTLANPPSAWAFTEDYSDSTVITLGFNANSNPAGTVFAIRDSTNQKWIAADGDTTSTKTWRTKAQWETTAKLINRDPQVKHIIGVVAANGDGIETAYIWGSLSIGNVRSATIAAISPFTHWYTNATYLTARNDTSSAHINALYTGNLGQKPGFTVYRMSLAYVIPNMDEALGCSLSVEGIGDQSVTDFLLNAYHGALTGASNGLWTSYGFNWRRYFAFDGWSEGIFKSYGSRSLLSFSSTNYAANMQWPFTSYGLTILESVRGDTLRFTVTTDRDAVGLEPTENEYITVNAYPELVLSYAYYDSVPHTVTATAIASDSILVTWTDNSYSETGFALVDAYTGLRIGGDDSTSTNATSKRMGGLLPNKVYNIKVKVLGGKIADDVSTSQDSARTWAAVPDPPTVTVLATLTHRKIVIDTTGLSNPGTTLYALQDSITGKYVRPYAGALDSMVSGTYDSSWVWQTFSQWGGANGDTIYFPAGNRSAFRIYSKNSQ